MIIEEDIYLEHFGVKGMQWGVRRNRSSGSSSKSSSSSRKKLAVKVAIGTIAVAGILATAKARQTVPVMVPEFSIVNRGGSTIYGPASRLSKVLVRDLPKLVANPMDLSVLRG